MESNAVAIKLPVFWTNQPQVWFAQSEAQFAIRGITNDETKFYHVVAALDQHTATRVVGLLENPPAVDKYYALKTTLLSTYGLTDSERAAQLLRLPGLGDSKPSELMDNMLSLLGQHKPCFLFRQLFLEQMPENIREHLALSQLTDYRELAKEADKLWLAAAANPCHAIHTYRPRKFQQRTTAATPTASVTPQAAAEAATTARTTRPAVQLAGHAPASDFTSQLCYYHQRFGARARKCNPPCSFQGNDSTGRQ